MKQPSCHTTPGHRGHGSATLGSVLTFGGSGGDSKKKCHVILLSPDPQGQ